MQSDIEGAARVVQLATSFNWTWKKDDIKHFCRLAGWEVQSRDKYGAIMRTGIDIGQPIAHSTYNPDFLRQEGKSSQQMIQLQFFVAMADPGTTDVYALVADKFAEFAARLMTDLSEPDRRRPGNGSEIAWHLPNLAIVLAGEDTFVQIDLVNPVYQKYLDLQATYDEDCGFDSEEFDELEGGIIDSGEEFTYSNPEEWGDFIAALAATVWVMPNDGHIEFSTDNGSALVFVEDYRLECTSTPGEKVSETIFENPMFVGEEWIGSRSDGALKWSRELFWPCRYTEYQKFATSLADIFRSVYLAKSPAEVSIEAWENLGITPDISAFGVA
ncbi:DUF6301 family protein [Nocardia sp. NPDC060249]|uniref:DUF6301 family protein n=1 Tax=Nocardia sp. NPDC060249 TaxID=3347082 RepID=UPI003656E11E